MQRCARCWPSDCAPPASDATADSVALTHGASEGIVLALRLFAEAGDAVAVEEPTYHNVLRRTGRAGLRAVPVPMRDGAPDLARARARARARPT